MVIQTLFWRTKIAFLIKIKLRISHLKISKTYVKHVSELCEWGTRYLPDLHRMSYLQLQQLLTLPDRIPPDSNMNNPFLSLLLYFSTAEFFSHSFQSPIIMILLSSFCDFLLLSFCLFFWLYCSCVWFLNRVRAIFDFGKSIKLWWAIGVWKG